MEALYQIIIENASKKCVFYIVRNADDFNIDPATLDAVRDLSIRRLDAGRTCHTQSAIHLQDLGTVRTWLTDMMNSYNDYPPYNTLIEWVKPI
jgi:hypothetical protein